jgi:hypothetical protein
MTDASDMVLGYFILAWAIAMMAVVVLEGLDMFLGKWAFRVYGALLALLVTGYASWDPFWAKWFIVCSVGAVALWAFSKRATPDDEKSGGYA